MNLLFGYQSGAGLSLLTFDWGMVASFANPLATPWWTTANILGGFVFVRFAFCVGYSDGLM